MILAGVEKVIGASFGAESIEAIGMNTWHSAVTWWDELFVGKDKMMGFRCPRTVREVRFFFSFFSFLFSFLFIFVVVVGGGGGGGLVSHTKKYSYVFVVVNSFIYFLQHTIVVAGG